MFDLEGFVVDFVAAARDNDNDKMVKLSESIADLSAEFKVEALEKIIAKLKETGDAEEIEKGLGNTLELMKFVLQVQDSSGEETKDDSSKVEEVTQDVAADTTADEAEGPKSNEGGGTVAESEGNAAAQEEQEQKS